MNRPSRSARSSGFGALVALPLLSFALCLAACAPWHDEDLAALTEPVAYRDAMVRGTSCGLAQSGEIYCWGPGGDGLGSVRPTDWCFLAHSGGNGEFVSCTKRPVPVFSEEKFVQLAGGASHTCAVSEEGGVFCWGGNTAGQLAQSPTELVSAGSPRRIEGLPEVAVVALNFTQTCAVTRSGELWCWGALGPVTAGGSGFPAPFDHVRPFRVGSPATYVEVALSDEYGCARTGSGEVDCWGARLGAELGISDGPACATAADGVCVLPVRLETEERFSKIVGGHGRLCGLAQPNGAIWCWGEGQAPALERPGAHLAVAVYDDQFCAIDTQNAVSCVGSLAGGDRNWPKLKTISVNRSNACGVALSGEIYCWGTNGWGQLGDGTTEPSAIPVRTSNPYAY